jgi:hypothetical protein
MPTMIAPNKADNPHRIALKAMTLKAAGPLLKAAKRHGDHLLLDQDMPAGKYDVEIDAHEQGWVRFTFTPVK